MVIVCIRRGRQIGWWLYYAFEVRTRFPDTSNLTVILQLAHVFVPPPQSLTVLPNFLPH